MILNENRNHNSSMITDPEMVMVNCELVYWFFFLSVNHLLLLPVTADFASIEYAVSVNCVSTEHIHTTNIQYRRHTCQYCKANCKFRNIELFVLQTNWWNKKKLRFCHDFRSPESNEGQRLTRECNLFVVWFQQMDFYVSNYLLFVDGWRAYRRWEWLHIVESYENIL